MATINSDFTMKWSLLAQGTPNIEFWYPADVPSTYVRLHHGVRNNVHNRRIIKTVKAGISAGGVYNFRNVGFNDEVIRLDIVLTTQEEADEFTTFFKGIIKGTSNVFYYRNNFTGEESIVRSMNDNLSVGEGEGHPYSFSLLLRNEAPYSGSSFTIKYDILEAAAPVFVVGGNFGNFSMVIVFPFGGTPHTVGNNSNGQLGLGDYSNRPNYLRVVSAGFGWVTGAGGESHTYIINTSGDLYSTGSNGLGQLGLGDTTTRNTFTKVGSSTWSKVACGVDFTGAIKADGTLWAWGKNSAGQLGQGSFDASVHSSPLQIGLATNWVDVKCGSDFLIAKKSSGELWGCGADTNGQLGQGSTQARRTSLVKIGVDVDWDSFDAGWAHTIAIKNNGDLYTWGANSRGELGDSTTIDKYVPIKIGSDTWKSVSAGGKGPGSSYGIKVSGTLWSWGVNDNYELGNGSADSSPHSSPILINSNTDWGQVAAGGNHGLAVKIGGSSYSWGLNASGECGVGGFSPVTVPTLFIVTF